MWLYAFSSVDKISTRVLCFLDMRFVSPHFGFHTLRQNLPKIPKDTDQFFFVLPPHKLAKLLRTINESKTIPPHPKIVASLHHQNRPRIACITAHAQKSSFSEEYCTLVQTSAEKTYAIQNENQKTLSLLHCSKPAGYSNLTKTPPPPSLRRYRARQKNSLHSDRQLGATKHALADMDGRLCASQVAERRMQHPAKGPHEDRSYIKTDLLDCPNRIACLLPYPSCPATTKNRPRPPIVSLASDTTSEISGYRQPNRKNAHEIAHRTAGALCLSALITNPLVCRPQSLPRGTVSRDASSQWARAPQRLRLLGAGVEVRNEGLPLSLSDPSSSLMLLGCPRLIDVVVPCLSPAPQPVLSRCAVERAAHSDEVLEASPLGEEQGEVVDALALMRKRLQTKEQRAIQKQKELEDFMKEDEAGVRDLRKAREERQRKEREEGERLLAKERAKVAEPWPAPRFEGIVV